jgi:CheY-like chemotaxis protein
MAKILIVDDEKAIRDVLKRFLEQEGNQVVLASDGLEALAILNDTDFDVALVDMIMPTVDGLMFMRRMQEGHPSVRIVVMSAYDEVLDLPARELGIVLTIKKPFTLQGIREVVEAAASTGM